MRGISQRRASGGNPRDMTTPMSHSNTAADLLAIPDIPPRPRLRPQLERVQDMSAHLQPRAAHRLWLSGAPAARENQGERPSGDRSLESGASQYRRPLSTRPCRTAGDCAGAKASACGGHDLRQRADGKGGEEQYSSRWLAATASAKNRPGTL